MYKSDKMGVVEYKNRSYFIFRERLIVNIQK